MRLTNMDRDGIVSRAVKARFEAPEGELKTEREALARKLYDAAFSKKVRDWAAQDPGKWLHKDECLRFNISGHQVRFDVSEGLPVPYDAGYCRNLIVVADEALRDEHERIGNKDRDLSERRERVRAQLSGMLSRITTLNKLKEVWPEGEPFYAHLAPRDRIEVPAVTVADINALLGLEAVAA